jgi:hypothetical protein
LDEVVHGVEGVRDQEGILGRARTKLSRMFGFRSEDGGSGVGDGDEDEEEAGEDEDEGAE